MAAAAHTGCACVKTVDNLCDTVQSRPVYSVTSRHVFVVHNFTNYLSAALCVTETGLMLAQSLLFITFRARFADLGTVIISDKNDWV